jgi:hypothetical protein
MEQIEIVREQHVSWYPYYFNGDINNFSFSEIQIILRIKFLYGFRFKEVIFLESKFFNYFKIQ